jgi:histidyl-tRNA synthetase
MTRGRRREHYQWNMDVWGEPGVTAEAELIAAVFDLLDRIGLDRDDAKMRISSRALLEETLTDGVLKHRPEAFTALCIAIDKLERVGADAVRELLTDPKGAVRLEGAEAGFVIDWLQVRDLDEAARAAPADSRARADLVRLFELLDAYGLSDRIVFDASIVRGLAYYTGVVFEAFATGSKLRSLCGGGRYDELLTTLGGPPIPAVGFGFGDAVIAELLAEKKRLPQLPRGLDAVVFAFSEAERPLAIRVATRLRNASASVEMTLGESRLKRVLADADRAGARQVYLLLPDEVARGEMVVRDLATGEQRSESLPD